MYCSNCGHEVAEGASFCSNCGNLISQKNPSRDTPKADLDYMRYDLSLNFTKYRQLFISGYIVDAVVSIIILVVWLLLSGGVAYTLGIAFYTSKRHYMHFVFHLFVLLGSILQYFCVLFYCL